MKITDYKSLKELANIYQNTRDCLECEYENVLIHVYEQEDSSDELINEAIKIVLEYNQASTSFLQRKLRVGFNRASRIMDELEYRGIISEKDGSKPRQVLVSREEINFED